jgi:hypothetical protein
MLGAFGRMCGVLESDKHAIAKLQALSEQIQIIATADWFTQADGASVEGNDILPEADAPSARQ